MTEAELEKLIEDSGVGKRTAKKLREAARGASKPATSTGHGAPAEDRIPVDVL
jgi:hypothetical protein